MKSLVVALAVTLLAPAVFAIPAVGDYAKYTLTMTTNGTQVVGTLETSLTAYDQASDSYSEHVVVTDQNGNAFPQDQVVPSANLISDVVLANLATECVPAGGTMGSTVVAAGTFATCNIPVTTNGTGNVWLGAVPFGIIQTNVTENGTVTALSLVSFTAGK
jgi:hypothetical protein